MIRAAELHICGPFPLRLSSVAHQMDLPVCLEFILKLALFLLVF